MSIIFKIFHSEQYNYNIAQYYPFEFSPSSAILIIARQHHTIPLSIVHIPRYATSILLCLQVSRISCYDMQVNPAGTETSTFRYNQMNTMAVYDLVTAHTIVSWIMIHTSDLMIYVINDVLECAWITTCQYHVKYTPGFVVVCYGLVISSAHVF